MKTKKNPKWKR